MITQIFSHRASDNPSIPRLLAIPSIPNRPQTQAYVVPVAARAAQIEHSLDCFKLGHPVTHVGSIYAPSLHCRNNPIGHVSCKHARHYM